jgi:hypothetical protein
LGRSAKMPRPTLRLGHRAVVQPRPSRKSQLPITQVVSTGRRNTRTKSQVQEFKWLSVAREHKCEEKAFCLGKSELRPQRIGSPETYGQIERPEGCCIDQLNWHNLSGLDPKKRIILLRIALDTLLLFALNHDAVE